MKHSPARIHRFAGLRGSPTWLMLQIRHIDLRPTTHSLRFSAAVKSLRTSGHYLPTRGRSPGDRHFRWGWRVCRTIRVKTPYVTIRHRRSFDRLVRNISAHATTCRVNCQQSCRYRTACLEQGCSAPGHSSAELGTGSDERRRNRPGRTAGLCKKDIDDSDFSAADPAPSEMYLHVRWPSR